MEDIKKMNILVLGNSGAGKSTLIKAISGAEVKTAVGGSVTQKIDVYESSTWPIQCIDTKGFEYKWFEQQKTIKQIKKFTKKQLSAKTDEKGNEAVIDAVWYCIDGCSKRVFTENIQMMSKSIKGWKNIPVFAVITKSLSEAEIEENVEAVKKAFEKNKDINLQKVIPVVAEPYYIKSEVVEQMGIEELCEATLDCYDDAKQISIENRNRMILEQKRFTANALTAGATTAGIVVGAAPISIADSVILVPLETALTKGILKIYDIDFSADLVTAVIGSAAITNVAKALVGTLKTIPNIAGSVINAVVAGFFVAAIGEAVIALSETIYTGKIDKDKIDGIIEFMSDKLKNNAALSFVTGHIEKNADKLQGKSAKEIFNIVDKAAKENTKLLKK
ncbi:MAG: 50S ribosome-binding GTPase [Clostridia bacterium]|nr:50S ribosome-binding GTPase [Clostridia bacterium]